LRSSHLSRIHFTILGAGAVGGVVGGLLHRAGLRVTLVARGQHLQALQDEGLRLLTPEWSTTLQIPAAARIPADTDIVLLAVKAHQVRMLLPDLPKGMPVVCLQNGIGTEPLIAAHGHPTIAGMVWMPTVHLEPGEVRSHGHPSPGAIDVGAYTPDAETWVPIVRNALTLAGIESPPWDDIMALKRTKLLTNLGGAVQAACGDVPEDIWRELVAEARAVYDAAGWAYLPIEVLTERGLGIAPVEGMARPGGSTWQSVKRGLKVETWAMHAVILKAAHEHNVDTPYIRRITSIAQALERPGQWSVEDLLAALRDNGDYNAWDISVLDSLEAVRKRPGMYTGGGTDAGDQLFGEVLANALDQALAGRCGRIDVQMDADRFTVKDDGSGMAPSVMAQVCVQMHGRPTADGHWPHVHLRARGIGLAPVNALSRRFEITSTHNGQCTRYAYRFGEHFETSRPAPSRGTTVFCERDTDLVPHPFDLDRTRALMERMNALLSSWGELHLSLNGEELIDESLAQYTARLAGMEWLPEVVVQGQHEDVVVDAAIWRADTPAVHAFVNFFDATDGDFVRAIQRMRPEPLVIGIHVGLADPRFGGPTREWLTSPEAVAAVQALIGPKLAALG
jgi:2-dehydropantoate 2-reductase